MRLGVSSTLNEEELKLGRCLNCSLQLLNVKPFDSSDTSWGFRGYFKNEGLQIVELKLHLLDDRTFWRPTDLKISVSPSTGGWMGIYSFAVAVAGVYGDPYEALYFADDFGDIWELVKPTVEGNWGEPMKTFTGNRSGERVVAAAGVPDISNHPEIHVFAEDADGKIIHYIRTIPTWQRAAVRCPPISPSGLS
ncbi:hypothetical protein ABW21_db0203236 [Orbilia brochopaga]|nr:hypothetical protein ABW21_db0203236 [Drechslerella brochopaga]